MRFFISLGAPLLGAALLLAELAIAGLGYFAPRVDANYDDYYISGRRSCWLSPAAAEQAADALRVAHVRLTALGKPAACFLLDGGWSAMERWGVWSDEPNAALELPRLPGKRHIAMTMIAFSPRNRQSVTIIVDGARGPAFFVPSGGRISVLTVDVSTSAAPDVQITFRIKHPARSSGLWGADQRHLGIGLIAIDWK